MRQVPATNSAQREAGRRHRTGNATVPFIGEGAANRGSSFGKRPAYFPTPGKFYCPPPRFRYIMDVSLAELRFRQERYVL